MALAKRQRGGRVNYSLTGPVRFKPNGFDVVGAETLEDSGKTRPWECICCGGPMGYAKRICDRCRELACCALSGQLEARLMLLRLARGAA